MTAIFTVVWGFIRPILAKYWLQIGGIVLVGGLVLTIHFKNHDIDNLNKKVAAITVELTNAKTELKVCQSTITSQNDAITAAAKKALVDQQQMDALNGSLAILRQQQAKSLDQIKKAPIPKTCTDTTTYLKNGIGDLQWVN